MRSQIEDLSITGTSVILHCKEIHVKGILKTIKIDSRCKW